MQHRFPIHLSFSYTFEEYLEANNGRSIWTRIGNIAWYVFTPFFLLGVGLMIGDAKLPLNSENLSPLLFLSERDEFNSTFDLTRDVLRNL